MPPPPRSICARIEVRFGGDAGGVGGGAGPDRGGCDDVKGGDHGSRGGGGDNRGGRGVGAGGWMDVESSIRLDLRRPLKLLLGQFSRLRSSDSVEKEFVCVPRAMRSFMAGRAALSKGAARALMKGLDDPNVVFVRNVVFLYCPDARGFLLSGVRAGPPLR